MLHDDDEDDDDDYIPRLWAPALPLPSIGGSTVNLWRKLQLRFLFEQI